MDIYTGIICIISVTALAIGTGNDVKIGASVGSAVAVLAIMFVTVVAVLVLYKSYLKRKSCETLCTSAKETYV